MENKIKKILNGMDCTDRMTIGMIYDAFKEEGIKVHYSSGATKGCFIFQNFVIKFKLDDSDSRHYDDCVERELQIYNLAKERGLEKILLPTEFFFTNFYGMEFIKQQKITCITDYERPRKRNANRMRDKNIGHKEVYKVRKSFYRGGCLDADWTRRAIHIYGKNFLKEFEKFTHEYKINDLHCANVGYLGRRPVILDFSGY